mmetsp:Transcript_27629/g.40764  ORF Transcript_27629/g.40764 Transcript_27629/m.40764 type:complete len:88 (-) Transcript_27629:503-766(-)
MQVVDPYLIAACSSADSNSTSKNNVILSKMTGTWRIIFEVVLAQRRMQQRAMLKLLTFFYRGTYYSHPTAADFITRILYALLQHQCQ